MGHILRINPYTISAFKELRFLKFYCVSIAALLPRSSLGNDLHTLHDNIYHVGSVLPATHFWALGFLRKCIRAKSLI